MIFRKLLVSRAIIEQGEEVEMASKKKRFSQLIEDIMIKTNQEKAKELLEVGFLNLPRDEDKGFIAQALARLQIEQFTEAKKWAEEAITLLENNFTMHDTIGQVYKRALRYSIFVQFLENINEIMMLIWGEVRFKLRIEYQQYLYLQTCHC